MTNKRILILGDIHGRTVWKDIAENETWDEVVFLGDYVSTHEVITSQEQIDNLLEIMEFKEKYPDKVTLLRGNHDTQHLGFDWAECSNLDPVVFNFMSQPDFRQKFIDATQWVYIYKDYILSHGGLSATWMENNNIKNPEDINKMPMSEAFGFTADEMFDIGGYSKTQPPTWLRPEGLYKYGYGDCIQIVGHTPAYSMLVARGNTKIKRTGKGGKMIWFWLNDCLPNAYIVLEDKDNIISVKQKKVKYGKEKN